MSMPRAWMPILGWCAATLASIAVATVALQPVLRTATPNPPDPPVVGAPPPPFVIRTPEAISPTPKPRATGSAPASPARSRTPTARTVNGWTLTTGADGQPTYLRSFHTCGGRAVIRITPGRVRLVTATPDPGFSVSTVQNEPGNLAVQFTEQDHYCIIHALWHNNGPFAQVSEAGTA